MQIPERLPGLRPLLILVVVYGLVWIALEGNLYRVVALGVGVTAVALGTLVQRGWGGRTLAPRRLVALTAVVGALFGLGSGVLTLLFMALKTGLHAHGPEFTAAEIAWVWQQLPLWTAVGLLAGTGVGLLLWGTAET